jgi:hypothetical protein
MGRNGLDLTMLGWSVLEARERTALWRDAEGDFLSLVRLEEDLPLPPLTDERAVREHCRTMAGGMDSCLVGATVLDHADGRAVLFVCRRLENRSLVFTGFLIVPTPHGTWMWEMVAKGQPVTRDLRDLCADCRCVAHPLARVSGGLRKLTGLSLEGTPRAAAGPGGNA